MMLAGTRRDNNTALTPFSAQPTFPSPIVSKASFHLVCLNQDLNEAHMLYLVDMILKSHLIEGSVHPFCPCHSFIEETESFVQ